MSKRGKCPFPRIRKYPGCFEDCPDTDSCPKGQNLKEQGNKPAQTNLTQEQLTEKIAQQIYEIHGNFHYTWNTTNSRALFKRTANTVLSIIQQSHSRRTEELEAQVKQCLCAIDNLKQQLRDGQPADKVEAVKEILNIEIGREYEL
jgi:site-specific recombinase